MPFLRAPRLSLFCCFLSLATCVPAAVTLVAAPSAPAVRPPGTAKVGDLAICPVQGQTFRVSAETTHAEWKGKTYSFCCDGCLEDFLKAPDAYTGPL